MKTSQHITERQLFRTDVQVEMCDLTRYVILDTDMGLDDAWAIVMLLTLGKLVNVTVLAITCTFGNTDLHYATSNLFRVLDAMGVNIPVYNGRSEPLLPDLRNTEKLVRYYGTDGFVDMYPMVNTTERVGKVVAAEAIVQLVKRYPKQVSFLSIGPLSNLAVSILLQEDLTSELKDIFIMGGNALANGNTRQANTAEWNFYADPEAANIVLNKVNCPIHIVTWEVCLNQNVTYDLILNGLANISSEVIDLLMAAEKKMAYSQTDFCSPDAMFMSYFLFGQQMVVVDEWYHAYVETAGFYTRGQVAIEMFNQNLSKNMHFILKVNQNAYMNLFLEAAKATETTTTTTTTTTASTSDPITTYTSTLGSSAGLTVN